MIRSMTGYGRAEVVGERIVVSVEARSLNHRHLDVALKLPRSLAGLELEARRLLQGQIQRGRLDVSVGVKPLAEGGSALKVDAALARRYIDQALALSDALGLDAEPTVEWVLERPGVVTLGEPEAVAPEAGWPVLAEALARAMEDLVARREAEGEALAKDLTALYDALAAEVERMTQRVPAALAQRAQRVRERIEALLGEHPVDEGRLTMEAAVWAEKTDISEELARLKAHLGQFAGLLREGGPVGRTLDFLVQEMNREVNTLASKANDLELSQLALASKGHLEKIREQVQNVE
ncbi:MAG: YicC family protein [Candidatus Rokubacteria bacterium RIFCSPLOWO2_02_FULL_68_19]|nr:MAG: YicC family protein [Candidatus Rokubacteria bacterium RIFCSPLOWO2_02_FULL_68_19]OGL25549.1 MAG: YicC family protein [Candidatus Rokubacteria bacterium RIFCSPLOWO2_12_FULL_69_21]